ncbi:hypothetical protein Tco_0103553 [Tanacetum coccineum]
MGQLKKLKSDELKEVFDKCVEKVEKFIPMNSELEASKLKRTCINLQAGVFKKQKTTDVPDVTKDEYVKREEEFKVQQLILRYNIRKSLARKGLQRNKSESARSDTEEDVEAYMDERVDEPSSEEEDHTDVVYVNFPGLLNDLTRDDLKELYRLMMLKYGDSRPEEEYERAAHIYMLTQVKYPLPSRLCQAMLEKRLIGDRKDEIFGNMKRGFRGVPRPLLPAMLPVVVVDQSAGPADQAEDQPSSSVPLPSSSHPPTATTKTAVPQSQDPTHPHVPEARTMTVEDLLHLVPNLITKVDSLETQLKQTKLTMGKPIVKLVKKVKKLEDILKRRHVVLTDSEDEEPEDQGRIIQDINNDPLVLKGDFVTPTKPQERPGRRISKLEANVELTKKVLGKELPDRRLCKEDVDMEALHTLKKLSFKEVKEEFDKLVKQVESFVPMNIEATKAQLKRYEEKLQTEISKKTKD